MVAPSPETGDGFSLEQAAWDQVERWSSICQRFLDWQRREILRQREPSPEKMKLHRSALKWLLRFGRIMQLTVAEPDYPDKRLVNELEGRLLQLQESWSMVHESMPDAEAQKLLREVFPEDEKFINKLFCE